MKKKKKLLSVFGGESGNTPKKSAVCKLFTYCWDDSISWLNKTKVNNWRYNRGDNVGERKAGYEGWLMWVNWNSELKQSNKARGKQTCVETTFHRILEFWEER